MGKPKVKGDAAALVVNEQFVELVSKILFFFKGDIKKSRAWLVTPNPMFGHIAPLKLFMIGRAHKVLEFVDGAAEEGGWAPREWELVGVGISTDVHGPEIKYGERIKVREIL